MIHCSGLSCDKMVEQAGQFCSSCEPPIGADEWKIRKSIYLLGERLVCCWPNEDLRDILSELNLLTLALGHSTTKEETK